MFGTIVGLLVFAFVTALLGWLARKTWVTKRGWVKWFGVVLAGLFTIVFALLTALVGSMD